MMTDVATEGAGFFVGAGNSRTPSGEFRMSQYLALSLCGSLSTQGKGTRQDKISWDS